MTKNVLLLTENILRVFQTLLMNLLVILILLVISMIKTFKQLPKDAEPIDKLSFVGTALFSGATPSFRFVYQHKKRFYIIQCFGGFGAQVSRYVTTKKLSLKDNNKISGLICLSVEPEIDV